MRTRHPEPDRREVVARRLSLLAPVPGTGGEQARPPARPRVVAQRPSEQQPGAERAWWADHTRVREQGPAPGSPELPELPEPRGPSADFRGALVEESLRHGAPVPLPGRHASRRPGRWPLGPPGSLLLAPAHLAVLAVLVALGLAVTSWWVVRSDPVPVAAPAPTGTGASASPLTLLDPGPATPGAAEPEEGAATVVVDVAGRVRRPGVVELPAGSRVVDALEAAGGVRGGVDLSGLNLARVLVDGEQVLVGASSGAATTPGAAPAPVTPGATAPAALVDLNTADLAALDALPEVGPVTAQAILAWREEHGGFTAVQELLEVDGIGPATLETLAPLVTV